MDTKHFVFLLQLFGVLFGTVSCGLEQYSQGSRLETSQVQSPSSFLDSLDVFVLPGDYVEMKIGIKGNHISGVFFDETSSDKSICLLLFEGIIGVQNPIPIIAYNPSTPQKPIAGTFLISGNAMIVKLNKTVDVSCNQEFVDGVGLAVVLFEQTNWSAIRMIAHSTPLYEDYGGGITDDIQLKNGDVVAIIEKRKSWYRVEVQNGQQDLGWIKEYSVHPSFIKQ